MDSIYIAGALFSRAERNFLDEINAICLDLGFSTYLPHKDGGLFIRDDNNSNIFFSSDKNNIENCKIILAVLNGNDIDSGTSWEIGYAFSKQKMIIGFIDDIRIYNPERQINPMIVNSLSYLVRDLDALKEILKTIS